MAQNNVDFSDNPTGAELMDDYLGKQQENILTNNSGVQRPTYAVAGTEWIDTSVTPWALKVFDGTDDILQGYIDPTNNKYIPVTPMSETGDIIVQGSDDNPARLASGAVDTVLTSNGVAQLPSYKVNPVGIKSYLSSYSYKLGEYVINDTDDKTSIYKSLVDNNTGNPLSDTSKWEEIKLGGSGGGLEIGDIGIAPFGIDESQNKRRYLNGQVISQAHFQSFTAKLKAAVQLYQSLATSEEDWQNEIINSAQGQCGKFVIDDSAGTIRLPKVKDISGLVDLGYLGVRFSQSAPNITAVSYFNTSSNYKIIPIENYSGAFYYNSIETSNNYVKTDNAGGRTATRSSDLYFDASRSNSTYGRNGNVLHQEAVQYPYFIQVATGSEDNVDLTNEIQLNNPFFLGMSQYFKTEPENLSWLKSDGQYKSGTLYEGMYEWILKNVNNGTPDFKGQKGYGYSTTDGYYYWISSDHPKVGMQVYYDLKTITGLTNYYAGTIVSVESETQFTYYDVAQSTNKQLTRDSSKDVSGSHWITDYDYVIDTENTQFRLPIYNGSETLLSDKKISLGDYVTNREIFVSPANGLVYYERYVGNAGQFLIVHNRNLDIKDENEAAVGGHQPSAYLFVRRGEDIEILGNASGAVGLQYFIYATGEGDLYYYVGETVQDANVIAASNIFTELENLKSEVNNRITEIMNNSNGTSWVKIPLEGRSEKLLICWDYSYTNAERGTITLPQPYATAHYSMLATPISWGGTGGGAQSICQTGRDATAWHWDTHSGSGGRGHMTFYWLSCGICY